MFVSFSAYPCWRLVKLPQTGGRHGSPNEWCSFQRAICQHAFGICGGSHLLREWWLAANFSHIFSRITEMNFGCVSKMYGQLFKFEFEGIFGSSLCFAFRAHLCKKNIYCIFFWILLVVVSQICQKLSTIEIWTNSSDGPSTCPPDHILLSFWCPLNPVNLSREKLCTVKPH